MGYDAVKNCLTRRLELKYDIVVIQIGEVRDGAFNQPQFDSFCCQAAEGRLRREDSLLMVTHLFVLWYVDFHG